ncbi:MAG: hypothetical protein AAFY67_18245 [Cyanobacteria bacterium J06642_9]
MKKIRVRTENSSYRLRVSVNGILYEKHWGQLGNLEHEAKMQLVAAQAAIAIKEGTFDGFEPWFVEMDTVHSSDLLKVLEKRPNSVDAILCNKISAWSRDICNRAEAKRFFDSIVASGSSRKRYLNSLKAVAPSLFGDIKPPKANQVIPDPFSKEELTSIEIAIADYSPSVAMVVMAWADVGFRNGELWALTPNKIYKNKVRIDCTMLRDGTIKPVPKNGKPRECSISEGVHGMLMDAALEDGGEFPYSEIGTDAWAKRVWRPALKNAGVRYRKQYCLRHTAITNRLVASKGNIAKVARECGTSLAMIQKHYAGVLEDI